MIKKIILVGLLTKKESLATMLSALKKLEMEKFGSTRKKTLERGLIFPIAAPPRFFVFVVGGK